MVLAWLKEKLFGPDQPKGTANVSANKDIHDLTKDPAFGSMENTVSGTTNAEPKTQPKPSQEEPTGMGGKNL